MKNLFAVLVLIVPSLALAHPDHSTQAFSIAHYFSGSHLTMIVLAAVAIFAVVKIVRAQLRD